VRPVAEVSGIVEAPADHVWEVLTDDLLPDSEQHATVEVRDRTIAVQGGWWYRGEWSVEPHPRGAMLVHRVLNVAQRARWGVPLANRFFIGFADRTREAFRERLTRIGATLNCPTHLT